MINLIDNLLNKLNYNLDIDLNFKQIDCTKRRSFARYAISLAARAPIEPYDCSRDDLFEYLIDVLSLEGNNLRGIMTRESQKLVSTHRGIEYFIARQMRLYSVCFLYQAQVFAQTIRKSKLRDSTLENILYIPAYPLLIFNRSQCNLSFREDRCLLRSSILLILTKLTQQTIGSRAQVSKIQLLLTSVVQNEYLVNRGLIRDKSAFGLNHSLIEELEYSILRIYVNQVLLPSMERGFIASKRNDDDKGILVGLKLAKVALKQFKYSRDIRELKGMIEKVLCRLILNHIRIFFSEMVKSSDGQVDHLWFGLLRDLRLINHDICLYWSRKGLDGLLTCEQLYVKRMKCLELIKFDLIKSRIDDKINDYLG